MRYYTLDVSFRNTNVCLLRDGFIVKNFLIRENDEGLRVITQVGLRLSAFFGPAEYIESGIGAYDRNGSEASA